MKIKRAVAILLVAVMLLVPVSSSVFAASVALVSGPIKVAYTDNEYFNPQGIVVNVDGKDVTYTPDNAKFTFVPALNEHIKVTVAEDGTVVPTEIDVYYDNQLAGTVSVTVAHIWGEMTYLDNNFHGKYCLGCGVIEERLSHNVAEFIPNDDGGLFIDQTQTGTCLDCGQPITESIPNTNRFNSLFDISSLTDMEMEILVYIGQILVPLIQMLVGLK